MALVEDRVGELAQIKRIRAFETQIRQADPALSDEEVTRRAAARAGVYDAGRLGQLLGAAGRVGRTALREDSGGVGHVVGDFSAINPGPLPDNYAETFAGGRYTTITLKTDLTLFRAGVAEQPLGQFYSLEPPVGVLQTRIDKAVLPIWPGGDKSPINTSFAVKFPAGTQIHIGTVGSQGGFYVGGTWQVFVLKPWLIPDVEMIKSSPLR